MLVDGQPHFVAKDVADRLGYANARQALITHCRGVQKLYATLLHGSAVWTH